MKKLVLLIAVIALFAGCQSKQVKIEGTLIGTYDGLLPCADCKGIETVLSIFKDGDNYSFAIEETYLGTKDGDHTNVYKGKANMLHELNDIKDVTIYELFPADSQNRLYFMVTGENVQMLSKEGHIINSDLNYTLYKRK